MHVYSSIKSLRKEHCDHNPRCLQEKHMNTVFTKSICLTCLIKKKRRSAFVVYLNIF